MSMKVTDTRDPLFEDVKKICATRKIYILFTDSAKV